MTDIVLQKYISSSGYCSRRQAEELIRSGEVFINGIVAELGRKVCENDIVEIYGKKIGKAEEKIYIALNKPVGYTCTNRAFKGEKNIFELLPNEYRGLHVVGRLDKNSRGLVLLTNDGDYTLRATHPRFEHIKKYVIRICTNDKRHACRQAGILTNHESAQVANSMVKGIEIGEGDGVARVKEIKYIGENKFEIILTEGKKRQIRRMFKVLGFNVVDLERVAIGEIFLDDLAEGKWKKLKHYLYLQAN